MGTTTDLKRTLRLLIVDDSTVDVDLLLSVLRSAGYQVEYDLVQTAPAMRAALEQKDWDLITSDNRMPHFSAPEALELAKELRSKIPIIIVSGETNPDLAISLKNAGAQDYVHKAELSNKLVPAIDRVLARVAGGQRQSSA